MTLTELRRRHAAERRDLGFRQREERVNLQHAFRAAMQSARGDREAQRLLSIQHEQDVASMRSRHASELADLHARHAEEMRALQGSRS